MRQNIIAGSGWCSKAAQLMKAGKPEQERERERERQEGFGVPISLQVHSFFFFSLKNAIHI
jgi:hypothetical protein